LRWQASGSYMHPVTREQQQQESKALLAAMARREWVPADYFRRAEMQEIFERPAPLEVDFGCGDGAFLLAMAKRFPERNFLGTERLLGRVEKVCKALARQKLENARILRLESWYTAQWLLPIGSASVVHVAFPDPWPKRQHHDRRLFQDPFMEALHQLIEPGGELRIKTDDRPYFVHIEKVLGRAKGFERIEWPDDPEYPVTDFEQHFLAQGLPIYKARLRRV
jgi:tRNA (guanine-N7-)-methyltransferase